ncbi:hypothetical protein [Methylobacterium sp. sgz302541]|uniref:hypothetical protein n=1 Tax=unclassified Methylobacterium TaxID=2615210 RepID=UPI003D3358BE
MRDNLDHTRRQRDALARERRRGLHRLMVAVFVLGLVATPALAGALTWLAL